MGGAWDDEDDPDVGLPGLLGGVARLAIDAVGEATRIVEGMHATVAATPIPIGGAARERAGGVAGLVYGAVRAVTALTGAAIDAPLRRVGGPALPEARADLLRSALGGVLGDHLHASRNPLAPSMRFRCGGAALPWDAEALAAALPNASDRVVLLVHGLCMSDRQWHRQGHDHGTALARDLGVTAVRLHYNSGRHVSENGRLLARRLEALVAAWPRPVAELSIVGHSMGGLVARSAHHYAASEGRRWPALLRRIVFLGTPHHGAPLERAGHRLQRLATASPYVAPLARLGSLRSAGITDLRHGNLLDEDWQGAGRFESGADRRRPLPLPAGVACYAVAAVLSERLPALGDGLVPLASALGRHPDPARRLDFPASHRWVGAGIGHLDLLSHREVYDAIRGWLAS